MSAGTPRRRNLAATAATAAVAAGLVVVAVAGCARQPAAARSTVQSCTRFGIEAIRHHVTVTTLPPACQGLTRAQVNFAVGSALHSAGIGAGGKVRQRERIAAASHFLERLVTTVPAQPATAPVRPAAAATPSRATLGLLALCLWLITVGLGLWMIARWLARGWRQGLARRPRRGLAGGSRRGLAGRSRRGLAGSSRRGPPGRSRQLPALNAAHLGLAVAGLLMWVAYLATRVTGMAWAACVLLPPVAGLGMTLVFGSAAPRAALTPPTGHAGPSGTAEGVAGNPPRRARRPPVLVIGLHIAFATATILFAFLTAIGSG